MKKMRKLIQLFLILLAFLVISCSGNKPTVETISATDPPSSDTGQPVYADGYLVKVGDKAPDFTINEAGGRSYKLSELKGKVVMLQFTASWCSVCRTEMPFIESEIWKEKKDKGMAIIGIDRDEPEDKVLKFKRDMNISYPLALDPGADIFGLYAQKEAGVTRNVIIDRTGKIIFLTRLFDRPEFDSMKNVVFAELDKK